MINWCIQILCKALFSLGLRVALRPCFSYDPNSRIEPTRSLNSRCKLITQARASPTPWNLGKKSIIRVTDGAVSVSVYVRCNRKYSSYFSCKPAREEPFGTFPRGRPRCRRKARKSRPRAASARLLFSQCFADSIRSTKVFCDKRLVKTRQKFWPPPRVRARPR